MQNWQETLLKHSEYLAKINQKYNVEIDPNAQIEKRTEANELTQTPIIVNNKGVLFDGINHSEQFGAKRGCNCTCRKAFMMTIKIISILLIFTAVIVLCALLFGGKGCDAHPDIEPPDMPTIPNGNGYGIRRRGGCCCLCPLIRWIKSDKWCSCD